MRGFWPGGSTVFRNIQVQVNFHLLFSTSKMSLTMHDNYSEPLHLLIILLSSSPTNVCWSQGNIPCPLSVARVPITVADFAPKIGCKSREGRTSWQWLDRTASGKCWLVTKPDEEDTARSIFQETAITLPQKDGSRILVRRLVPDSNSTEQYVNS